MEILVTGVAGFIGSHTADALIRKGHHVIGIDCINDYYSTKIKRKNLRDIKKAADSSKGRFTFYKIDFTNKKNLDNIFKRHKIKKMVHLAARAGVRPSIEFPLLYDQVNTRGTLNLLEACRENNVKKIVMASSSSVYGKKKKIPFAENDKLDAPVSPYAATKMGNEFIAKVYHTLHGMDISCMRFFTVYGPRGRPDMAPYLFTDKIYRGKKITVFGDGNTSRDYTFIDDIVQGIMSALKKNIGFEIFNLGNSKRIKLKDMISTIEKIVGKKADRIKKPRHPADVPITYADINKSKRILGYKPTTDFKKGMEIFFDWYLENIVHLRKK